MRSFPALIASGLLLAAATLALSGCNVVVLYKTPQYGYAGRPVPPSGLLQRVMAAYTANGTSGGLAILDGLRDLRGNIQNTIPGFKISGFSEAVPISIINYPEQTTGYVLGYTDGNLTAINYSKETASGTVAKFGAESPSVAATPVAGIYAGAAPQSGVLVVTAGSTTYDLNLPGVNQVAINPGGSVILATVENSDLLYRVVLLPQVPNPTPPPGYVDCEPLLLPVYCVVPVGGTYDRPSNVSFSLDGNTAYVLNSGPENGGKTASVSFLNTSALYLNNIPTVNPLGSGAPSPLATLPSGIPNPIPVPGGVTAAISDSSYLYLSGQQLQTTGAYKGLFAGNLTTINLANYSVGPAVPISDGTHTKMLFADNNTLWIGASNCSNGVRFATAASELSSQGYTDQSGNYNCLTLATAGVAAPTAQVLPAVVQSNVSSVAAVPVPYPNTNQNQYYYGSLTGLCWVQNYYKVYTAYGGQIHAFYTGVNPVPQQTQQGENANGGTPGSEIDNINVTVQGTVLDVAYIDAESNSAN
ncbi:MAG: hypothetical protein HIU91_11785 [Acidobacteria bacterium]|nr:hypothetical protein [Acidobacteriota bacterium]